MFMLGLYNEFSHDSHIFSIRILPFHTQSSEPSKKPFSVFLTAPNIRWFY